MAFKQSTDEELLEKIKEYLDTSLGESEDGDHYFLEDVLGGQGVEYIDSTALSLLELIKNYGIEQRLDEWDFAGDVIEAANQYALDKYVEMKDERIADLTNQLQERGDE